MGARLGQHFLNSPEIVERIISAAELKPGEDVIEIGPGRGALTDALLAAGARLSAIELDGKLAADLSERHRANPNFQLLSADFLKVDLAALPRPVKFVSNLPYAVATPILQKILAWDGWTRAVLMFQKEVAERIVAGAGSKSYGILSLSVFFQAKAEVICEAPKEKFRPPPQVDSAVVLLTPRRHPALAELGADVLLGAVKASFAHRRKTIENSLMQSLHLSREKANAALKKAGIEPGARAEEVAVEPFVALARALRR